MEVLDGNQPDEGHTRRKQDKTLNRSLFWFLNDADIELCPHSPLAFTDVLSSDSGLFNLIAQSGAQVDAADVSAKYDNSQVVSIQQRRQKRHPRQRANLLTQLNETELFEACKHNQVQNALVKKRGVKGLFLTAGFLCWSSNNVAHRAPLLFYPATLIRKQAEKNDATSIDQEAKKITAYELRIDNNIPYTNVQLQDAISDFNDSSINGLLELPQYDPAQPMQDYFAQTAEAIAGIDGLELEFNIGLGLANAPTPTKGTSISKLPKLPENFDTSLAMAITGDKTLQQLNAVLHLLQDYQSLVKESNRLQKNPSENKQQAPEQYVSLLHEYARKLQTQGLASVEFGHLASLPQNISVWLQSIDTVLKSPLITKVLEATDITPRHLIRLAGAIELIDKAPKDLKHYKHADLCYGATAALLQRARHQAGLIAEELSSLQSTFVLDKVPAKKQLLSLIEELGGSMDQGPDFVDADYFNARRQFMEFSLEKPSNLTPEHRRLLGQLAKVLRFRELFVNNTEYRLALGPGYCGLRTDWDALQDVFDYSQEFSEVLESEYLAAAALKDWDSFRSHYVSEFESLQHAAAAMRKLLWVCGSQLQRSTTTSVLEHAQSVSELLTQWESQYGHISPQGNKTPADVLAQFSNSEEENTLTEKFVGQTQAAIDQHINHGNTSSDAVLETLQWLRQASKTAAEFDWEITAIVDHLQIA